MGPFRGGTHVDALGPQRRAEIIGGIALVGETDRLGRVTQGRIKEFRADMV